LPFPAPAILRRFEGAPSGDLLRGSLGNHP
jgi:hypothetical protein